MILSDTSVYYLSVLDIEPLPYLAQALAVARNCREATWPDHLRRGS